MSEETRPSKAPNEGDQSPQALEMIEEGSPIPPPKNSDGGTDLAGQPSQKNSDGGNDLARQPSKSASVEGNDPVLEQKIVAALKTCFDPEIPVNIYELGLIYKIQAPNTEDIKISMTLTSPMCPVAESLPIEVEQKIRAIPEIKIAQVDLTWDPPWNPQMMSEAAKLQLNLP